MSYEIFYDKQFVKVNDELFIPMIYAGSNNCYQYDLSNRGRRERSWFPYSWLIDGKLMGTAEEMLAKVDKQRTDLIESCKNSEDKYKDESFGWHTSLSFGNGCNVSFNQYKSFIKTAIKKALTIEQLAECGISVQIYCYVYDEEKFKKETGKETKYKYARSTEEFFKIKKELEKYYEGTGKTLSYSLSGACERIMKRVRARYFPRKAKQRKNWDEIREFYVLRNASGHYFAKKTKRGYRYSYDFSMWSTKKFERRSDAERYRMKYLLPFETKKIVNVEK